MPAGLDEYLASHRGIEASTDGPGEDLPREVVNDGVDVRLGAVEQLEDRDVDVPDLIGARGTNADGGFCGVNAKTRPAPTAFANEPGPGGRGGEDFADALGVEAQSAQWHVAVLGREDHVLDGRNLGGG